MSNAIKVSMMLSMVVFPVFLPKVSYAWEDQQGHGQHGRGSDSAYHRHDHHSHANPDLTLVTGMDDIDTRVLVDADPGPAPEVVDQAVPEAPAAIPSQVINSDGDGNFIVNVPNNAGGYTPVRIQKSGNGYVGPQGELYYPFPQISQLKAMYGI